MPALINSRAFLLSFILVFSFSASAQQSTNTYTERMADSIMSRSSNGYGPWNYETATVLRGFELLYKATGDQRYFDYLKTTVDNVVSSNGSISSYSISEYNLDQIKEGSLLLYLYSVTGETRYRTAADTLMTQIEGQPRTSDGGNWHKNKYPNQMWLDGLYMAQPFNAQYGAMFNRQENFSDAVLQLRLMEQHARDANTGLLYHGWDESGASSWANNNSNTSPVFWGRSLGWYAMALIDVLEFIPAENTSQRNELIAILQRLITAMAAVQDTATGAWWQVADKGGQSGNWIESSVTAMYVYVIARGVREGYLNESYLGAAQNGWNGLINEFVSGSSTLNLSDTCTGTSVGGSYSFYTGRGRVTNDPKGLGPFLMAGVEIELMGNTQPQNLAPVVVSPINDIHLVLGQASRIINLNQVFSDPEGSALSFSFSSVPNDANVTLNGSTLIVEALETANATYKVRASDGENETEIQFVVLVQSQTEPVSIVLQAEDQNWDNARVRTRYSGYLGSGYVDTVNRVDTWFEFSTDFSSAATYEISVRYANNFNSNPQAIYVDGALAIDSVAFASTGSWTNWSEQSFSLNLSRGTHTIRFVSLGNGAANLDQITVTGGEVMGPPNTAPSVVSAIANINLYEGDNTQSINLNTVFNDADGDVLSYEHNSSVSGDINVQLNGSTLDINAYTIGSATHTINANDGRGGNVSTSFVLNVQPIPQGGDVNIFIEAEDQSWSSGTVDSNHSGYTGQGFVNTANSTGAWIDFAFGVPQSGQYNLTLRYANGSSNRPLQILLNGSEAISSLNFPGTGAWNAWSEVNVSLALVAGNNSVRLVSLSANGAANIDSLRIVSN